VNADPSVATPVDYDDRDLRTEAPAGARYVLPEAAVKNKTFWTGLQRAWVDHLVRTRTTEIFANKPLKLYSRVGESWEDFIVRCRAAAEEAADKEVAALRTKYEAKVGKLKDQLATAAGRAQTLQAQQQAAQTNTIMDAAGDLLGSFFGGRKRTSSMVKSVSKDQGRARVNQTRLETAQDKVSDLEHDLQAIEAELQEDVVRIDAEWAGVAERAERVSVPLEKSDVSVSQIVLAWVPTA
jgi:hypothetical protein